MKKMISGLLKFLGKAVTLVIVIALLPYVGRFLSTVIPDNSRNMVSSAQIISQKLEAAQFLTTMEVRTTGNLHITDSVIILGEVQNVDIAYEYTGGFGIDLSKVYVTLNGNKIVVELPSLQAVNGGMRILSETDSTFQLKSMTPQRRQKSLDDEQARLEEIYLRTPELVQNTKDALEKEIGAILSLSGKSAQIEIRFSDSAS